MSDDQEETYTNSDQSESSDYEDDNPQGLGFLESTTLQRGVQTETAIFAKWENHTRGIASKMMVNMGYRGGMGLGASGQGMLDPVSVRVLPPKQSLDNAVKNLEKNEENKEGARLKKHTRGGKRKRDKKISAAAKAAEEESKNVFYLINTQLAKHGQSINGKKQTNEESKKEDRRALLAYEDEIKNLRLQIEKLEEMVNRNRREKVVYDAAMRKLKETRKALVDAEMALASTSSAVARKDKEKKWLKF